MVHSDPAQFHCAPLSHYPCTSSPAAFENIYTRTHSFAHVCVYKKAKVSLKIDAQRKWIKREDGMNGAEKYRACFLCHLSLSLSARRSCWALQECSALRKKCHPHRRRSRLLKDATSWCGALIDSLYYYMGDIMRLLTERKGLQGAICGCRWHKWGC